jgi:hypothetical protein
MWSIVRIPFTIMAILWLAAFVCGLVVGVAMASGH